MSVVHIVAHIELKPEFKEELTPIFRALVDGSRAEAGNVSYLLTESLENPASLTVIECWESPEAITTHGNTPHFQAFAKAMEGKATKLEIIQLKKLM